MRFVPLGFWVIFFYAEVFSFSVETSHIDTSGSLSGFEVLRRIDGGSPLVNYSNGVASYSNIRGVSVFRFGNRVYFNNPFVGGWDANSFGMIHNRVEYSRDPFVGYSFKFINDNPQFYLPQFVLRYGEGPFGAMTAALMFQRHITDRAHFKIDVSGKVNSPGENSFWYSFRNSEDEFGRERIYYSNDNRRVAINLDLGFKDFRDNLLTLMFDRELNFYDNFVWRNHSVEDLRRSDSLFSQFDTLGLYRYRYEAAIFNDTANVTEYMGFDYDIIEGPLNLNINSGQSKRISHLGHSILNNHISLITDYNFQRFVLTGDFGFAYEKTSSADLEKIYHSKMRSGRFGINKWIFDNIFLKINYGILDYDYSLDIHQSLNSQVKYHFRRIDAAFFTGISTEKQLRDHTLTNDLNIRIPLAPNPDLLEERVSKVYFGVKSSDVLHSYVEFARTDNKVIPINHPTLTNNLWKFYNLRHSVYRLSANLRVKYELPFMFTTFAGANYNSYNFIFNDGFYSSSAIGEHFYRGTFSLNRRFSWLGGRLLGNIKGEYEFLSPVHKVNFSDINYNFEDAKNIFNLYSSVILNRFIMFHNIKNITNEIMFNDYGALINPLTFQWGVRWYLLN